MSNRTLHQIAQKITAGQNLTEADLANQIAIARQLYGSEMKFEQSASHLQTQHNIVKELAKVFPDKYLRYLQTQI